MKDIFSIIAFAAVVIYFLSKHSESIAKLNKMQIIGVIISFILTTLIAGNCIYYGTSFLVVHFQNRILLFIIRVIVVITSLWLAVFALNYLLQRISKGNFTKIT